MKVHYTFNLGPISYKSEDEELSFDSLELDVEAEYSKEELAQVFVGLNSLMDNMLNLIELNQQEEE